MKTRFALSLMAVGLLGSCALTSDVKMAPMPVKFGMTKTELESRFGKPLRMEKHRDGREDWFYKFATQEMVSEPVYEAEVNEFEQTVSVGRSFGTTTTIQEEAVHLSPSGRVFGTVPKGRAVLEE